MLTRAGTRVCNIIMDECKTNISIRIISSVQWFSAIERDRIGKSFSPILYKIKPTIFVKYCMKIAFRFNDTCYYITMRSDIREIKFSASWHCIIMTKTSTHVYIYIQNWCSYSLDIIFHFNIMISKENNVQLHWKAFILKIQVRVRKVVLVQQPQ